MSDSLPYPLAIPRGMTVSKYLMALLATLVRNSKNQELVLTASDILSAEGMALTISPTGDKKGIILRATLPGTSTFFVDATATEGGPSSQPQRNTVKSSIPSPPTRQPGSQATGQPSTPPNPPSRHAVLDDLELHLREEEMIERLENRPPSSTRRQNAEPGLYPFRNVSGR